jgi:hypothetical protein
MRPTLVEVFLPATRYLRHRILAGNGTRWTGRATTRGDLMKVCASLLMGAVMGIVASPVHADGPQPGNEKTGARSSAASSLQLGKNRPGRGDRNLATSMRGFSKPPAATAHALIMTIGDYPSPIPKLKGVASDAVMATEMAQRMGVPRANIRTFRDGDLTLEGMRRAFDELEDRLGGDDLVFVYYSGHGTRQRMHAEGADRCADSLIAADGKFLTDAEIEARLSRLRKKAQRTLVFIDASHSGGVGPRSVDVASEAYAPKSYTPPGLGCIKPPRVLPRRMLQPIAPGSGSANSIYITAGRDNEIALDQPGHGGVASQAWLLCLSDAARDADGSGGLSASEIQACAQRLINRQLENAQGVLPHHLTITGNPSLVLSYRIEDASPAEPASAKAALADLYHNRDDRRLLTLEASRPLLKIGQDIVDFTISSREGGHVYLLMADPDGKAFDLLFPNQIDQKNQIQAGGRMRLPRPDWVLLAEGPAGTHMLLAMVTETPRDFSAVGLKPAGPFLSADALAARDIQLVTAGATKAIETGCGNPAGASNPTLRKPCTTSYAAALLPIVEVQSP